MASERLETAEKIVRMTEWNNAEPWEYAESEHKVKDPLAAAKRYVSAQAFLLSWQEGKVPTGWRRPRKLQDFDGKYPQQVIDQVNEKILQRISERNFEKTAQINAILSAMGKCIPITPSTPLDGGFGPLVSSDDDDNKKRLLTKADVNEVKRDFNQFSHQLYEAKSALRVASNTAADVSLRLKALTAVVQAKQ